MIQSVEKMLPLTTVVPHSVVVSNHVMCDHVLTEVVLYRWLTGLRTETGVIKLEPCPRRQRRRTDESIVIAVAPTRSILAFNAGSGEYEYELYFAALLAGFAPSSHCAAL